MGTHNMLLRLGEAVYLEVIAIDPEAPPPEGRRWFDLDGLSAQDAPRLRAWVARTDSVASSARACTIPLGAVLPMRRGHLHWLITVPESGLVPLDGVGPALIEWPDGVHPCSRLPANDVSLETLTLRHHDPDTVDAMLASLGRPAGVRSAPSVEGALPSLSATVRVGARTLRLT
jgi:hypothetical protein